MAVTLVHNCPHCRTENAGFTLVGEAAVPNDPYQCQAFFQCNGCFGPIAVVARSDGSIPSKSDGDFGKHSRYHNLQFFPKPAPPTVPGHIPESSGRAFIQADDAIKRQHWEAASAMDRRALEIATKEIAPAHAKLGLYQRIERLANEGLLTESLKDWAHGLRVIGNDALHEIDGLTEDEAKQAHELAWFVLIYLYTLPAQVAEARQARENGN